MNNRTLLFARAVGVAAAMLGLLTLARADAPLDTLAFGVPASENAHGLTAEHSDTIVGGFQQPARRLLPLDSTDTTKNWEGGRLLFTLKVDPAQQNYVTIRLWGSDVTPERLILFCEGKQIGYHHLGDVDILDFGSDIGEPGYNGRFFYNTSPLPVAMTRGKTELHFEIRAIGNIWGYGNSFEQYQKPMNVPTRGIYRLYTHTGDGCFVPPAREVQGDAPTNPPVRATPGPEVIDAVKARVNREIDGLMHGTKPLSQMQMQLLARAYSVAWTPAYHSDAAFARILVGLDAIFAAYRLNPKLAEAEPSTPNPDWFGLGPSGNVINLLATPLRPHLDETIDDGKGGKVTRRAAYAEMLVACRDWHRKHRRLYTNQTMINDLYGIYLANRGIEVVDPTQAMSETDVRRYLYESLGLQPWRDSDPGGSMWNVGDNYWQLTDKGLTRELGYVGTYGEVIDWATEIYDATRPALGQPGDPKIEAQVEKIAHARAYFRYPTVDAEGNRAMRLEPIVGWRDSHYPSDVTYGERPSWDASPLYLAAATDDTKEIGYAQQMFADDQYFASVRDRMKDNGLRVTAGLLDTPDEYEHVKARPAVFDRLPMSPVKSELVWADEQDGVVAIKHGEDILYASLYWRARNAVNFRARVHYLTPRFDRIAVVAEETQYMPSGLTFTQPDWPDTEMPGGGKRYPVSLYGNTLHEAFAGEVLPIAKIPDGIKFKPGDENVYAGRGDFYTLHYGPYLIAMNTTTDHTYTLKTPTDARKVTALTPLTATVSEGTTVSVGPRSTVVFYVEQ